MASPSPPPQPVAADDDPSPAPQRQSSDQLKEIVAGLYTSPSTQVPVQRLPQLIKKLERETGLRLLAPDELGSLEAFAGGAGGLLLAEGEMLALLEQMMPPASSSTSASPLPPLPSSSPTPPSPTPSTTSPTSTPTTPAAGRRASSSSRIRTSSDSSSSSSSSGAGAHRSSVSGAEDDGQTVSLGPAAAAAAAAAPAPASSPLPSQIPRRPKPTPASSSSSYDVPSASSPATAAAAAPLAPPSPPRIPSSWERFSKPPAPSRRRSKRISADLSALPPRPPSSSAGSRPPSRASDVGSEDGSEGGFFGGTARGFVRGGSLPPTPSFAPASAATAPAAGTAAAVAVGVGFPGGGPAGGRRIRKARQVSHSSALSVDSASTSGGLPALFLPPGDNPELGGGGGGGEPIRSLSPSGAGGSGLDESPFFALQPPITSPGWADVDDADGPLAFPRFAGGAGGGHGQEMSVGDDGAEGSGEVPEGGVRLQREPSTSTFSLSTAHDALSSLSKTNADLTRSLSALKAELEAKAADYEVQAEELLARADELRVELGVSRREEKELRGREAAGLRQIAVFEAEIATLHKALDRSKASYQALVKMHHEQMQASEDLRNAVRERDVEAVEARETIDGLRADGEKWARDQLFLEETQARLLSDLDAARQAETYLDAQKAENLGLKETINRLRADLDELRLNASASAAAGGVGMSREGSGGGKGGAGGVEGTMGKSLEKELLRQLRAADADDGGGASADEDGAEGAAEGADDDDSYIETYITTSRRRIHGQRTSSSPRVTVTHDPPSATRDFHDVGTQAALLAEHSAQASVQTDESALAGLPAYSPREVKGGEGSGGGVDGGVQAALDSDDDGDDGRSTADGASGVFDRWQTPAGRRKSRRSAVVQNIYNTFHYTRSKDDAGNPEPLSLLSLLVRYGAFLSTLGLGMFLAGLQMGRTHSSHLTPLHHALANDFSAWNAYNDLARGQGAGGGGVGLAQSGWETSGWWGLLGAVGIGAAGRMVRVPT